MQMYLWFSEVLEEYLCSTGEEKKFEYFHAEEVEVPSLGDWSEVENFAH